MIYKKFFLIFLFSVFSLQASDLYVTSLNDSGPGTFREVLNNLSFDDNIIFNASLSGTITLQSALPSLSSFVKIVGPSGNTVSIDGANTFPLLNVLESSFIRNLNFVNGVRGAQYGAIAIAAGKVLTLENVNITPSSSIGGEFPIYLDGAILITKGLSFSTSSIPGVYLDEGVLEIQNSTSGNSQFVIDGMGQVLVKANETATLTTPSSSPVNIAVIGDTGAAIFNGTSTEPFFTNVTGGELLGNYTCFYVVNGGKLQPGNTTTFGVNNTTEDWNQISEGVLYIKLDASGNSDVINVGQYANIAGGLTLIPSSGSYMQGTKYTFFNASAGFINQKFDLVTSTNPSLDFQVNYYDNSIEIEILSNSNL